MNLHSLTSAHRAIRFEVYGVVNPEYRIAISEWIEFEEVRRVGCRISNANFRMKNGGLVLKEVDRMFRLHDEDLESSNPSSDAAGCCCKCRSIE